MPALSVIICTHNPRPDYLRRTLDALKAQTLPKEQWELLLIDNASKEPLASVWDLSWHPRARHIREEELGLTPARLRGIRESKGELLLFVDDDNVLNSDYLVVLMNLAAEHTNLGTFGAGVLEPDFEQEPAPELRPYLGILALRTVATPQWSNAISINDLMIPWGAGLAVRRVVAEKYIVEVRTSPIRKQLGRSGSNLNSCEDNELSWVACELGLGKGLFPALQIRHLIDRRRVAKAYMLGVNSGHGFSQMLLAHLHDQPMPPKPSTFADILGCLFRGKVSTTLRHASSWRSYLLLPAVDKEFEVAWQSGVDRARKTLAEMKPAKS